MINRKIIKIKLKIIISLNKPIQLTIKILFRIIKHNKMIIKNKKLLNSILNQKLFKTRSKHKIIVNKKIMKLRYKLEKIKFKKMIHQKILRYLG